METEQGVVVTTILISRVSYDKYCAQEKEIERLRAALKVIKRFPFPATEVRKTATQALKQSETEKQE